MRLMTMPKYFILILVIGFVSACGDDFITKTPPDQIVSDNFYKNASDFNNAVLATYSNLQSGGTFGGRGYYLYGEVRSDNTTIKAVITGPAGQSTFNLEAFGMTSDNTYIDQMWTTNYSMIAKSNIVLDRINEIDIDEDKKKQFKGEAQFLRGLAYFYMVRIFGGVPLVLHEVKSLSQGLNRTQSSVDSVYQQITKDLQNAESNLPVSYNGSDVGRATKGAAKALLAKVYLTRKNWSKAKSKAKEVMNAGQYRLLPDYEEVFNPANSNNDEIIFSVQFVANSGTPGEGSDYINDFKPYASGTAVGGEYSSGDGGYNIPTNDMVKEYEEGDLRKNVSLNTSYKNADGETVNAKYISKYFSKPNANGDAEDDFPVLRYSDVLLMFAEASNEMGYGDPEALNALNTVRERAGLRAINPSNQEIFREAVYHERRVELAFEDHRWFDLLRTGQALEVMNSKADEEDFFYNQVEEYKLLAPIPQSQLNVNSKLKQNPGY